MIMTMNTVLRMSSTMGVYLLVTGLLFTKMIAISESNKRITK